MACIAHTIFFWMPSSSQPITKIVKVYHRKAKALATHGQPKRNGVASCFSKDPQTRGENILNDFETQYAFGINLMTHLKNT